MKHILHLFVFLATPLLSLGQNSLINSSISSGIGNCYTTQEGVWSLSTNPAGMANHNQYSIGIGLKNNFGMNELSSRTFVSAIPTSSGVFGVSVQQYGFELYNENKFGISFSKKLSKNFNSAIKIDYYNTHIENLENTGFFTFELGVQKKLNNKLTLGSFIHDPIGLSTNTGIPSIIAVGLVYNVNNKVKMFTETESTNFNQMELKLGLEYQIIENMYLRSGYSSLSNKNTFGFSYNIYNKYLVDLATYHHQTLGFSSQISFSTSF